MCLGFNINKVLYVTNLSTKMYLKVEKASRKLRYVFSVEDVEIKNTEKRYAWSGFLKTWIWIFFFFYSEKHFFLGFVKQRTFKEWKYKGEEFWVNSYKYMF